MARSLRSKRAIPRRFGYTWAVPDEVHVLILSQHSLAQLANAALVSRSWCRLVHTTAALWEGVCQRMWAGRHVLQACRALRGASARAALRRSLAEARTCHISKEELCSLEWSFRFKHVAGHAWTAVDPWWLGQPARTLRFEPGGNIVWTDEAWNGLMRWRLGGGCVLRVTHAELGGFPAERLVRHLTNWGYVFHSKWVGRMS
uniref:F-box domain-containing protein n=1 Tax=Calcidiscus leptoporus TaxID=127549 RepID=A0A7S0NM85_9EUKA|mmetsp:Transcript_10559/g.24465  ORF Transcript_10559/g.24465 Transcript_10559/m.24465 type:complete len:202 (+) Transcript_10559:226-831(+)